jgi:hypothetical protein
MPRTLFVLVCLGASGLVAGAAHAQPDVVHEIHRATSAIDLDGSVDEVAWSDATSIELEYEVEPGENIQPPVRTTCLITYDDSHVYFAFRAGDPDPSMIRARYSDRDQAWSDDWVGVVLDTFNDQRRAYELFSTPLGVQIDAINDDVGRNYDSSWNAIWESAGQITNEGFEVEMAVPFNQIRFQQVEGDQVWGFDAIRSWPRQYRHHIGVFPRDRGSNSYLTQAIKIRGMQGADPGSNMELIPTLTSSRTDVREDADANFDDGSALTNIGASLRWGVTPSMSLNAAVNPDFSQIEADAIQLAVNEQFALFFDETRPFFLEGKDYFNTDLRLVYTRNIVDPDGAGKLTGKSGGHTWGFFTALDNNTNVLVPGPEGSSGGSFGLNNWSSTGRYRYDFGSSSTIGATVTDRRGGDYANSVYSADLVYRITDQDQLRSSFAWSRTEYDQQMRDELGVEPGPISDAAVILDYRHTERDWWIRGYASHYGNDYRSDLGFRPRVGYSQIVPSGARIWWGEEGDFFQRRAWGLRGFHSERDGGGLLEQGFSSWINGNGPRESYGSVIGEYETKNVEGRDFDLVYGSAHLESQINGNLSIGVDTTLGDWIDFTHARPASRYFVRPSFGYAFGRHLNLNLRYTWSRLDVDPGRLFSVHAPELRIIHQFNARMFIRLVMQYRIIDRDPTLYTGVIDSQSESLLTQFLFSYKLNPQTAVYVGYNDNQYADDSFELTRLDRTFFLKLSYAWVR